MIIKLNQYPRAKQRNIRVTTATGSQAKILSGKSLTVMQCLLCFSVLTAN